MKRRRDCADPDAVDKELDRVLYHTSQAKVRQHWLAILIYKYVWLQINISAYKSPWRITRTYSLQIRMDYISLSVQIGDAISNATTLSV